MSRACTTQWEKRTACKVLFAKPERMKLPRRIRRKWEDNNKMVSVEVSCGHGNLP
jgi:hypothetical protein